MAAPRKRVAVKKKAAKKKAPRKSGKRKSPAASERPLFSIRALAKLFEYAEKTIREHIKENGGPVGETLGTGRASKLDPAKWLRFFRDANWRAGPIRLKGELALKADCRV